MIILVPKFGSILENVMLEAIKLSRETRQEVMVLFNSNLITVRSDLSNEQITQIILNKGEGK